MISSPEVIVHVTQCWQGERGQLEKLPLDSINVVQDYNHRMFGCDLNDQMTKKNIVGIVVFDTKASSGHFIPLYFRRQKNLFFQMVEIQEYKKII